jgi:hypothetical protein
MDIDPVAPVEQPERASRRQPRHQLHHQGGAGARGDDEQQVPGQWVEQRSHTLTLIEGTPEFNPLPG